MEKKLFERDRTATNLIFTLSTVSGISFRCMLLQWTHNTTQSLSL